MVKYLLSLLSPEMSWDSIHVVCDRFNAFLERRDTAIRRACSVDAYGPCADFRRAEHLDGILDQLIEGVSEMPACSAQDCLMDFFERAYEPKDTELPPLDEPTVETWAGVVPTSAAWTLS